MADACTAAVTVYPDQVTAPLSATLFGANSHPYERALLTKPEVIDRAKKLGMKSLRFPNGCVADQYDWRNPRPGWATVDEWLDFCDAVGAEPYYTVNMQGGTEGLAGPPPADTALNDTIKYRHTAPNPCGNTDYTFGTLSDTLEFVRKYTLDRARAGKRPILHYELGNENWGQSRTDWPPDVYAKTCEVYAKAMRKLAAEANLKLYIVAVGYPVMGNNMKFADTPDRAINVKWTALLNKLHEQGLIDAVQEHFYPYASANGGALAWVAHNMHNIILARRGAPNPRLDGYRDPAIAYTMPMEHTEWNIKCWGSAFAGLALTNPGFEDGLEGWTLGGKASASPRAARRGAKGVRVELKPGDSPCEVCRVIDRPEKSIILVAGVWVRTAEPDAVKIEFRQANDGPNKGKVLGGWAPKIAKMWERVVASAKMEEDTRKVELVLRVEEPGIVYFDEIMLYHTAEERGHAPLSATTYEQVLFCVDALREMAAGGCPRSHLHHLVGNYPCGIMTIAGETKDLGKAFEFFAGAYGDRVVRTDLDTPAFGYASAGNPWATDFNALAPDREDIPMLSCLASRTDGTLHVLLVNRTSDRDIDVTIDLGVDPVSQTAKARTLTGPDIDLPGAEITEETISCARKSKLTVAPYSARIVSCTLSP